ncbi:MAG: transketolase [Clostridiales Family XIII bacterium]|jgi:transketolase|nr:transketolase [Clostridiales Family XIII bacterium]
MLTDFKRTEAAARAIRAEIIRQLYRAGSGHPGGSLSAADIAAVLYFDEMRIDPKDPRRADRDKFVLSKGHAAPLLYATLAERGYFPKEELHKLRKLGALLQGHPNIKVPGVEMSTGSLGQGFSASVGMALAARMDGGGRVYALLGDGELEEGLVWEAAMSAAHYRLDNLCAVVDWNGLQIDGRNEDVMTVAPIGEKFASFGFHVLSIDGHSLPAIAGAFEDARTHKGAPTVIVAKTVKGKGVSFMENEAGWHGRAPNEEEARKALAELGGAL